MASSSHSTAFGALQLAPLSLDPFRDEAGFLSLIQCSKCRTLLIGHVSQKPGSKGKKFYKCLVFEHTDYACKTYYFEVHYVELLVAKGILPRGCNQIRGGDVVALQGVKDANDTVQASQGVEACQELLEIVVVHLKDSEGLLKNIVDGQTKLLNNVDKTGDRLIVVAVANHFVLVLVLLVLLVK